MTELKRDVVFLSHRKTDEEIAQLINYMFFCEYANFDFSKFEVSWLMNLYPHALKQIAKDSSVKEPVRLAVANVLKDNSIAAPEKQRLQGILVNYFC